MANSPSGSALPLHLQSSQPPRSVGSPTGSSDRVGSPLSPQRLLDPPRQGSPVAAGAGNPGSHGTSTFSSGIIQAVPGTPVVPKQFAAPVTMNQQTVLPEPVVSPPITVPGGVAGSNPASNGTGPSSTSGHAQSPTVVSTSPPSSGPSQVAPVLATPTAPVAKKSSEKSSEKSSTAKSEPGSFLSKEKIEQLAKSVDPNLKLDEDVQDFLQQYAAELVDEVATMAAKLAQARKSKTIEVQDVKYYLEHNWNMFIPGFGADAIRAKRKVPETEAHKNRQAIIKKHLKKF